MKIIFFGTPAFAANILDYLIDNKVNVVAVVTQSNKQRGNPSEVKIVAEKKIPSIEIFQPEKASDPDFIEKMKSYNPDLFVVVAYGKILRPSLLEVPFKDSINVHASLLPKYRGAAPIQRALINGEKKTGITIMKIVKELDAGDIIAVKEVDIDEKINFLELHDKLCAAAKPLLLEVIKQYEKGEVKKHPQNDLQATYASKITAEDLEIDFNKDAFVVHCLIRGLSPIPGARCSLEINNAPKKVKILESEVVLLTGMPGEVVSREKGNFIIACKKDAILIKKLQIEGKKPVSSSEFISGIKNPIKILMD